MQWKIEDSGLKGPIELGANSETVKSILGEPSGKFKRTAESEEIVVAYDDAGLHLVFDNAGFLRQLSVFPNNEVFMGGVQLVGKPIDSVYRELQDAGIGVDRVDTGLWCERQKTHLVEVEGVVDGVEIYRD